MPLETKIDWLIANPRMMSPSATAPFVMAVSSRPTIRRPLTFAPARGITAAARAVAALFEPEPRT